MNENPNITLGPKDTTRTIRRPISRGEKGSTSYLPVIFLIALVTLILIDVLNG